jgi:hypothetical protein
MGEEEFPKILALIERREGPSPTCLCVGSRASPGMVIMEIMTFGFQITIIG